MKKREYVNDKGLYLIAQYMRVTQERPVLDEIRRFLASAGRLSMKFGLPSDDFRHLENNIPRLKPR